jgi:hypothetical protein
MINTLKVLLEDSEWNRLLEYIDVYESVLKQILKK